MHKQRPDSKEYTAHQATYIGHVPEGDILSLLEQSMGQTPNLLAALTEEEALYRYAPGKWSVKEVIGHIIDNERIMSARLLRIARGDDTPLPGYDQDVLMQEAVFDAYTLSDLQEDWEAVRRSTLSLLRHLPDEAWGRWGTVSGSPITVRALAYIIAGHELHHVGVIKEKYLNR